MARPILAVVPAQGHAAATLRDLEAPATIVDPADTAGVGRALESLLERWQADGLPDVPLPDASARPHLAPCPRRGAGRAGAPCGGAQGGGGGGRGRGGRGGVGGRRRGRPVFAPARVG